MTYYFWASENKYNALIDAGYTEKECHTDDREVLQVNTDNKTFEVVHKHVNCNFAEYMEDVKFIIEE